MGQQASLTQTLLSLKLDVCCVSETRIQDLELIRLSHVSLCEYPVTAAAIRGMYGVRIYFSSRDEDALLDWIPVNSRLCAVRLNGVTKVNAHRRRKRCLFVISAYAPTDVASEAEKDNFYRELTRLVRCAKNTDILVLAGDMKLVD